MRKSLSLIILSFIAIYFLNTKLIPTESFGRNSNNAQRTRIGVILPLSGSLSEYGLAARNGIKLAMQDFPEQFGALEFVFEDSIYDAKTSISAFNKLSRNGDTALIYNWGTATGQALAPIAQSRNIALISNTQTPEISQGREFVVRFINPAQDFSKSLLSGLRKRGFKRFAIIKTELAYINDMLKGMEDNLEDGESIEIIDTYETGSNDFRSTITKLKSKSFDAVGVFLISGQVSQFYRQLAEQRISYPSFGTDFFESSSEIAGSGAGMEGAIYANIVVPSAFKARYIEEFENDTHLTYASNAYDFALLTAELFSKLPASATAREVLNAYRNYKQASDTSSQFAYVRTESDDKYFSFPVGLKQIENGKVKLLSR